MKTRFAIAVLVYMMVQAVIFGIAVILLLTTPLAPLAMKLMPWVVGVSLVVSVPIACAIAPRLQRRFWAAKGVPEAPPI